MPEMLSQGGYTLLAILAMSVIGLAEAVYCFWALREARILPRTLVRLASDPAPRPEAVEEACRETGGPFAHVLRTVLASRELPPGEAEPVIEAAGREAAHALSRGVLVLEVIAAVAPLLGLLGTVLGMQEAFGEIGAQGVREIAGLPEGISKALLTTIAGLIVAIPSYILYSTFERRVERLVIGMEKAAALLHARLRDASRS
jgi:biopolymer transport protein ExbB